jgi:hypothetical protein
MENRDLSDQLSQLHADRDYFYHEGVFEWALQQETVDYRKRDFLFKAGEWRGIQFQPLKSSSSSATTLVVGHSDYDTNLSDLAQIRVQTGYRRIFAENIVHFGRVSRALGARPLPLGLGNPTQESPGHLVFGDSSLLTEAYATAEKSLTERNFAWIYSNFVVSTAPRHRHDLDQLVSKIGHIRRGVPDPSKSGRATFLAEIRESGLVLCPRGNGHDTHRLYETLYMGALPVLLRNSYQFRICRHFGFPAVGLKNWNQLADLDYVNSLAIKESFTERGIAALGMTNWIGPEGALRL